MRELWKNETLCLKLIALIRQKRVQNFTELAVLMKTDNNDSLRERLCKYLPGVDALIRRNHAEVMTKRCTESGDHEGEQKWARLAFNSMLEYHKHGIPLHMYKGFTDGKLCTE